MNIAPTIAATAAKIAPPATPFSATSNMCASLFAEVQLGQAVPVAVFVPAGTGPEAYFQHDYEKGMGTDGPAPWFEGPL
jgi:hypothetical protein